MGDWKRVPLSALRHAWKRIQGEPSFSKRERRLMFRCLVYRTQVRMAADLIDQLRAAVNRLQQQVEQQAARQAEQQGDAGPVVWPALDRRWGALRLNAFAYRQWHLATIDYVARGDQVMRVAVALARDGRARLIRIRMTADGQVQAGMSVLGENLYPWLPLDQDTIPDLLRGGQPVYLDGLVDWEDAVEPVMDERLADELRRLLDDQEEER